MSIVINGVKSCKKIFKSTLERPASYKIKVLFCICQKAVFTK